MTAPLDPEAVVAVLSRELDEDFVGLWTIWWYLRRQNADATLERPVVELAAARVLQGLVGSGARFGTLTGDGSWLPWAEQGDNGIRRAISECRLLAADPNIGAVAWLRKP